MVSKLPSPPATPASGMGIEVSMSNSISTSSNNNNNNNNTMTHPSSTFGYVKIKKVQSNGEASSVSSFGDSFLCGVEETMVPLQQQQQQQQRHPQRLDREQPSSPAPTKPTLACETFESSPHDDDDDDHDGEPQKLLYQSKPADVVREEPIPQWIKWITVVSLCLLCSAVIMITLALLLSGNGETDNNPTTSEASNGNLDNNPSMLLPTFPPSMAPSSPRRPTLRPTTTLGNDQQSLPTATTASPTSAPTSRSPSLAPISRSPTLSPASGAPTLSPTREGPTKGKDSKRNED
mmetsp:Transcript_18350/g.39654  ORF Transcript_18350/g.39654 Transcript_18350/m.39654 type:complete len:292 (-) Transcript_18350:123-998(-)|eukprot:CAMPEP_0168722170 /NCGR_PEP_ID=MMETSP0724-20121128/2459_1 /TAXON_ID=265536 /ORGANISM="Amphiprora sp., Strain CCMP467" /LENGTH=291 /DNA_ID=CAMNT_0008768833 /DNA_START=109 /DNA_END=984 /DNA_ORIENTATION=+